jgi:pyruvate dehydrogenase E2 component (dihydrolipoamide acetyltransferase)
MPIIKLPQAGKTATSATVRRWMGRVGEAVGKGDVIVEVETDEGVVQIQSPVTGRLVEHLAAEGRTIAIGTGLAVVDDGSIAEQPEAGVKSKPMSRKEPGTGGKVIPILMPKAGQSMEEGTLVKWHVKAGEQVSRGQVIFEIETDKANMEVEASDEGRLAKIVLDEGGTIAVMQPVAYLAESEADVEVYIASQGEATAEVSDEATKRRSDEGKGTQHSALSTQHSALSGDERRSDEATKRRRERHSAPSTQHSALSTQHSFAASADGRVKASPAARKLAADRGVDLASLPAGSGPGGRILSSDVPATASFPAVSQPAQAMPVVPANAGDSVRRRMSPMRKAIAKNLSISKQTIPHFYIRTTINAEALLSFYQGEKAKYPCSVNDVVIMACAKAIMAFAPFRSQIDGEQIVEFASANIGIAVGMDEGLVVPVLVAAERLTLQQIGSESRRLAMNARGGRIEAMGKGVFTITNMGMLGVEEFGAIINPPEAAILAVGAAREEVIVSGGTLKAGRVMTLTLSVDHRIIDGSLAAKFMAQLKEILERC